MPLTKLNWTESIAQPAIRVPGAAERGLWTLFKEGQNKLLSLFYGLLLAVNRFFCFISLSSLSFFPYPLFPWLLSVEMGSVVGSTVPCCEEGERKKMKVVHPMEIVLTLSTYLNTEKS